MKSYFPLDPKKMKKITPEAFHKANEKGIHPYKLLGLNEKGIRELYALAMQILDRGEYEDAADAFRFLTLLDGMNEKFWIGLGNAEQGKGNYLQALEGYYYAAFFEPDDPFPSIYMAQCLVHLEKKDEAIKLLEVALEKMEGDKMDEVKKKIEELCGSLEGTEKVEE